MVISLSNELTTLVTAGCFVLMILVAYWYDDHEPKH